MPKKRKDKKLKKEKKFTSIEGHKRYKSLLKSPLSELNIERFD